MDRLDKNLKQIKPKLDGLQELNQHCIKIADSCPLVNVDDKKVKSKKVVSEQEREAAKAASMKKKAFFDKINKELDAIKDQEKKNRDKRMH